MIIKNTYDPGSCFSDVAVLTTVYIVFDPEKISKHERPEKSSAKKKEPPRS